MSNSNRTAGRNLLGAAVAAAFLFVAAIAGTGPAYAAGACALIPNARTPSEKPWMRRKPDVAPRKEPAIGRYTRRATRSRGNPF